MNRFPLVVRIYALGVLLSLLVIGSFVSVAMAFGRGNMDPARRDKLVVDLATRDVKTLAELDRTLAFLHQTRNYEMIVRDANGVVIARSENAGALVEPITIPLRLGVFAGGTALVRRPPTGPPTRELLLAGTLILLILALLTVVIARNYGGTLARIAAAARSFGQGELTTRVNLARKDELGEVAHAFDEMATSIERLRRADRELLADVSHELRTPLSRIGAALDVAADNPKMAQAMLREITEDLGELQRLVEDVLTSARLDLETNRATEASTPLRRGTVVVADLVEQSLIRFRAVHREALVEVEIAPALPDLDGDSMMLRRVIDNLLENARKYGKSGEAAIVRAKSEGETIVIEVEDRGTGIAKEDLESVFRPFFRADTSRTRATGGLGLGLALARRIVEAHGGTITIESTIGVGTLVRVRLPL